jgi:hypothetical protein
VPCITHFSPFDKIPTRENLKEGKIYLSNSFRGFSLLLNDFIAFRTVAKQYIMVERGGGKLFTS